MTESTNEKWIAGDIVIQSSTDNQREMAYSQLCAALQSL
jgi:hypothetical protein